jgi:hypothetical protein
MSKHASYGVIGFVRARDGRITLAGRARANSVIAAAARAGDLREALIAEHMPAIGTAMFECGGPRTGAASFRIFGDLPADQWLRAAIAQAIADFENAEPATDEGTAADAKGRSAA